MVASIHCTNRKLQEERRIYNNLLDYQLMIYHNNFVRLATIGTRMYLQDLAGNTDIQSYPQPNFHWLRENLSLR